MLFLALLAARHAEELEARDLVAAAQTPAEPARLT
jgi:hypothetical protein